MFVVNLASSIFKLHELYETCFCFSFFYSLRLISDLYLTFLFFNILVHGSNSRIFASFPLMLQDYKWTSLNLIFSCPLYYHGIVASSVLQSVLIVLIFKHSPSYFKISFPVSLLSVLLGFLFLKSTLTFLSFLLSEIFTCLAGHPPLLQLLELLHHELIMIKTTINYTEDRK